MLYTPILRHGFELREEFGTFLNQRELVGSAVEIGVHRADFACQLLNKWKGKKLYGVDHYPKDYDLDDPVCHQTSRDDDIAQMKQFAQSNPRFEWIRLRSEDAVYNFNDNSLDFIYLDAKHRYADVRLDLIRWWSKLKVGGIFAGHDFICPCMEHLPVDWSTEVQPAVWEFANSVNVDIWLVTELPIHKSNWSFYLIKE